MNANKTALIIDGPSLHYALRILQHELDFFRFKALISQNAPLALAEYHTITAPDLEFSPLRPLLDWLRYNGFRVNEKVAGHSADHRGRARGASIALDIAVSMIRHAEHVAHIVLVSGNGDLTAAVASAQRKGAKVSVVSTLHGQPVMISDELRRQADHFVDLRSFAPALRTKVRRFEEQAERQGGRRDGDRA